jgi:hypothetical protein
MLQIGELVARPWRSAWTPVEVEARELTSYLQLLDLVTVRATMSEEFGTTICVKSGLEEVVTLFVMCVKERTRSAEGSLDL